MPAATDKFKKVGNPGTATTLSAPGYTVGATSLTVASTTNHPTDTGVCASMYEVTTVGTQTVMTPGSYNEYDGVVSGATSITSLSHVAGSGTDRNYAAGTGTVVTIMVSSGRENDLIDGLLVSHDQDGTLKDGVVTNAKLSTAAGELGGAWQTWAPTLTGITVGAGGTLTCKYTQVGKTVSVRIFFKFGTGSAITGDVSVTLPLTAAAYSSTGNITQIGQASAFDGASIYFGSVAMASTTTALIRFIATGSTYASAVTASATVPMTWNTNHELTATFEYEAA